MTTTFDRSVAVFVRGLGNLHVVLRKARAYAVENGTDPEALLRARLADDMNDLAEQAHWAAEGARLAVARILGEPSMPPLAPGRTFAEIEGRVAETIAALGATEPATLDARWAHPIELPIRGGTKTYEADHFLAEFAIPSFFFHLTTAYCILRAEGVPLTKGDFLGV